MASCMGMLVRRTRRRFDPSMLVDLTSGMRGSARIIAVLL